MEFQKTIRNPWIVFPAALAIFVLISLNIFIFKKAVVSPTSESSAITPPSGVVSYMDAIELCVGKTRKNLGSEYLRHELSDRSSFYDESAESYRITLKVDKGSYSSHESITTQCLIPYRRLVVEDYKRLDKDGGGGGSTASVIASSFNKKAKQSSDDR